MLYIAVLTLDVTDKSAAPRSDRNDNQKESHNPTILLTRTGDLVQWPLMDHLNAMRNIARFTPTQGRV